MKKLSLSYGWAKFPMANRMGNLHKRMRITMLFGEQSWILDRIFDDMGLQNLEQYSIHVLKNAGHHVYADAAPEFNLKVLEEAETCDKETF